MVDGSITEYIKFSITVLLVHITNIIIYYTPFATVANGPVKYIIIGLSYFIIFIYMLFPKKRASKKTEDYSPLSILLATIIVYIIAWVLVMAFSNDLVDSRWDTFAWSVKVSRRLRRTIAYLRDVKQNNRQMEPIQWGPCLTKLKIGCSPCAGSSLSSCSTLLTSTGQGMISPGEGFGISLPSLLPGQSRPHGSS